VFNPIFGPDGRPCKVLQAGLDVTDARLAQSRLQDSINYASQIQRALHEPSLRELAQSMPGSHALQWEPRDTVGGDCLFARELSGGLWFCLFDCTGHGAPGALLASIVLSETDRILSAGPALSPGDVISRLNRRIKESLGQAEADQSKTSDDGLDAVVIRIDPVSASARVASSGIPVFVVEPGSPTQILMGSSGGIGYRRVPLDRHWETRTVNMGAQTRLFAATDGIFDQPGGPSGVGYGRRCFAGSLAAHASLPVTEQMVAVIRDFREYQGLQARRDDIAVAGLQIPRT
jgi:serine phosphatase RsbU (regulator of sigma subunit)